MLPRKNSYDYRLLPTWIYKDLADLETILHRTLLSFSKRLETLQYASHTRFLLDQPALRLPCCCESTRRFDAVRKYSALQLEALARFHRSPIPTVLRRLALKRSMVCVNRVERRMVFYFRVYTAGLSNVEH